MYIPVIRHKVLGFVVAALLMWSSGSSAQQPETDMDSLYEQAMMAMGMTGITRLAIQGEGWEACLGQPWHISEGWPAWSLTDYERRFDYSSGTTTHKAMRQPGRNPSRLGGCGAQPNANPGLQQSAVTQDSSWEQQLQLWLTPVGFLRLANRLEADVTPHEGGWQVNVSTTVNGIPYRLVGTFNRSFLLQEIQTWIDNTVFGDMRFEARFSDYRDFNGVLFPGVIEQLQGGFNTLYLNIDTVMLNPPVDAEPAQPPRRGSTAGDQQPRYVRIAQGVYVMLGSYQSVAMEFADFAVVIDGLQSDARAKELIAMTREAIPGKPIRYVVNTHAHFDHASGLRAFAEIGATILTHSSNVAFYESALNTPRTLDGDGDDNVAQIRVQGVEDKLRLDDGNGQVLELYKLNGSLHADDMLIAYLPASGTVVEADLLQPWINPVFAGNHDGPHPFLVFFANELERLQLDYQQFVPIHQPNPAPLMFRSDLLEAVGE